VILRATSILGGQKEDKRMMCSITRPAKAQRLAVRRSPFAVHLFKSLFETKGLRPRFRTKNCLYLRWSSALPMLSPESASYMSEAEAKRKWLPLKKSWRLFWLLNSDKGGKREKKSVDVNKSQPLNFKPIVEIWRNLLGRIPSVF